MEKFEIALEFVFKNEGGFVNHNFDKGGATNFGITHKTLRRYKDRHVTLADVRAITKEDAALIYKTLYWDPLNIDSVDLKLSTIVFDQGVNRGPRSAVKQLQSILSVYRDGMIGPVTLKAIERLSTNYICIEYIKESQLFYINLVKRSPGQFVFLKGWINRTHELLDFVLKKS